MILTGKEDLRVVKTIEAIKQTFDELICEKDFEKITVKELCDRARINKKTFYHYYPTLDDLLAELQLEISSSYIDMIKDFWGSIPPLAKRILYYCAFSFEENLLDISSSLALIFSCSSTSILQYL